MLFEYSNILAETFVKAATESVQHSFSIANKHVNIIFSNTLLASKLLPAFAHLENSTLACKDLTIHVWDSKTSGVITPKPSFTKKESNFALNNGYGYNVRYGDISKPRFIYVDNSNPFMCFFDPIKKQAFYWYEDASKIPYYEKGAPMHTLFDWWLETQNLLLTHAGAIGNEKGGVLIVGKGGQGKSTTAISSLWDDDLYYIADDYLILQNSPNPKAYSLYNTGKLNYDHLTTNLPHLLPLLDNPKTAHKEKALFFFNQSHEKKMIQSLSLSSAILPLVSNEELTTYFPVKPMKLLIGLASSTIYQSSIGSKEKLNILTSTLANLPCYALNTGKNLSDIPKKVKKLIEQHAI
ncbi:hypothetical protein OAT18_01100 [Tenacibaculum sp.]|nr:hypothetical protein [Tenacibaculum sp.]